MNVAFPGFGYQTCFAVPPVEDRSVLQGFVACDGVSMMRQTA